MEALRKRLARVAEWQTRWLQVPVPARAWGFKSPLAHEKVFQYREGFRSFSDEQGPESVTVSGPAAFLAVGGNRRQFLSAVVAGAAEASCVSATIMRGAMTPWKTTLPSTTTMVR